MPFPIFDGDEPEPVDHIYVCLPVPNTRTHRLAFQAQIHRLTWWQKYQRNEEKSGKLFARAFYRTRAALDEQLIDQPEQCGDEEIERCYFFPPSWSGLTWFPRSPYEEFTTPLDPLNVPIWLVNQLSTPPFIADILQFINNRFGFDVEESIEEITGLQRGDVLSTFYQLTSSELDFTDNPGFSFDVSGTGEIELTFVTLPLGGRVAVSVDEDPFADFLALDPSVWLQRISAILGSSTRTDLLDTDRDITSIPPETESVLTHKITISDEGTHTINVRWLPVLNDTINFVSYGAGFRGVEFCGFDNIAQEHEQMTEEMIKNGTLSALREFACGCCDDGSTSGGGAVDEDNDGIDDVTGDLIVSDAEAQSAAARAVALEFIDYIENILSWSLDDAQSVAVAKIAAAYSGVDASAVYTQANTLMTAYPQALSDWQNTPNKDDGLTESIGCSSSYGSGIVNYILTVIDDPASPLSTTTAETVEFLFFAASALPAELLDTWSVTNAVDTSYLGWDCTPRERVEFAILPDALNLSNPQNVQVDTGIFWSDFNKARRRVLFIANGKLSGVNSNNEPVEIDWFYRKTERTDGTIEIVRPSYVGAPMFRIFVPKPAGVPDTNLNYQNLSYNPNTYRVIAELTTAAAGSWQYVIASGVSTEFSSPPTGQLNITMIDTGQY